MIKNNLELMGWSDGTIRLTFWDNLHGEDESYILSDDGQAYIEDEKNFRIKVNLVYKLIELIKKIEQANVKDAH